VYSLTGMLAVLAGIILTSRLNSAQPTAGTMYELDAIAAVVIGGTSLMGGRGRISGTLIGALIIGVISNGLNLLNVSSFYQQIVNRVQKPKLSCVHYFHHAKRVSGNQLF